MPESRAIRSVRVRLMGKRRAHAARSFVVVGGGTGKIVQEGVSL